MNLLITGGCGHIGSYLAENINKIKKIKNTFVVDNLKTSARGTSLHDDVDEIKDLAGTTGDGIVETFNKPSSADNQTNSVADPIAKSRS